MKAKTLHQMSNGELSIDECRAQIRGLNIAMMKADISTVNRARMWFAQTGEESVLWTADTEFASGAEYNWRSDLGNNQPGDGERFKGRGKIQLTGRDNYAAFGAWIASHNGLGLLIHYDKNFFVKHPEKVAHPRWTWLVVAFYWIHDHNHGYDKLNKAADAQDVQAATLMINGGLNGFDRRKQLWDNFAHYGQDMLPRVSTVGVDRIVHLFYKGGKIQRHTTPAKDHPNPTYRKDSHS